MQTCLGITLYYAPNLANITITGEMVWWKFQACNLRKKKLLDGDRGNAEARAAQLVC